MEMQEDNRPAVNIGPSTGDDDTARASIQNIAIVFKVRRATIIC